MILSTNSDQLLNKFGDEKAVEMLAKAGFDAIDYSFCSIKNNENHPFLKTGYASHAKHLKECADSCGVFFNQAHAVFPTGFVDDENFNKLTFEQIIRNFEIASNLGIKNIVVHPIHCFGHKVDEWQYNMDFYGSLLPYAKEFGIKMAIENMWRKDPNRGFIVASALGYGKELAAITKALGEIDYIGDFTFEADMFFKKFPDEMLPIVLKFMHDTGRQLIKMIEDAKIK